MTTPTRADWYSDPYERFELRYFNGKAWTSHVASAGVQITDPEPVPEPATPKAATAKAAPAKTVPAKTVPAKAAPAKAATAKAGGPKATANAAPAKAATPTASTGAPTGAPPTAPPVGAASTTPYDTSGLSLTEERRRQMGWLTVGCGAVVALSAFLTWGSSSSKSVSGVGMGIGYVTGAAGVLIALYGWQALRPGPIKYHRSHLTLVILTVGIAALAASAFDALDDATFGSQAVEAGIGAHLTLLAAGLTIWPHVLFRRDYWQRRRARRDANARRVIAANSASPSTPLPPGIPPAPR